ncbi:MAG: antibiotic biosynthesis monooxygenase [Candidatus Cybelea sp.]
MNARPIISLHIFTVKPGDFDALVERATEASREASALAGFVSINICGNATHTKILIASQWKSEEAWSRTQWDEQIGIAVTDLIEGSQADEFELYWQIGP